MSMWMQNLSYDKFYADLIAIILLLIIIIMFAIITHNNESQKVRIKNHLCFISMIYLNEKILILIIF